MDEEKMSSVFRDFFLKKKKVKSQDVVDLFTLKS